jgi:Ankyrin repeats (3 copies)
MFAAPFLGVFSLVGAGIILLGVVTLTRRLSVHIELGRLIATDKTLFRNTHHDVAIGDVVKLIPTRRDNTKQTGYYRINATLNDGREINLADDIADTQMAGAFLSLLQRHLRLPDTAVGSLAHAGLAEQQRRNTPAAQTDGARLRKRVIVGATAIQLAVMAGIGWHFFSPDRETASATTQAASPSPPSTLDQRDQALFDSLHNVASNTRIPDTLNDGANVNATNDWGATPLVVAAGLGDIDDMKLLIRSGANINFAVTTDNKYKGRTALMQAAHTNQADAVALLLDAGANATVAESHGWSAMHYAARNGDIDSLRVFKQHGVNLDQPSPVSRGETPLMIAARSGEIEAIKALIELGADPHLKDREGENAYGWAKYFNQPAAMAVLQPYQ